MIAHERMDAPNFWTGHAATLLQSDRIKPKLGHLILSFDMHMGRFIPITDTKEEAIRTDPQYRRHEPALMT